MERNVVVHGQYQQKSEILYIFTPSKTYGNLSKVQPKNLVFWKTYNTGFDDTTITFTDQNGWPIEIEDKVKLTRLINKSR